MDVLSFLSALGGYVLSGIVFLIIFSVLIVLHEFGHFWAARKAGIKVLEFGFGLPPKLWGKKTTKKIGYTDEKGQKKTREEEMEWTINAIPFGGFVRMEGEEDKSDSPFAFGKRPLLWRILVVSGGVIMNFLLGWFLLSFGYLVGVNPLSPTQELADKYVAEGFWEKREDVFQIKSITKADYEKYGIGMRDMPISLDGKYVTAPEEFIAYYTAAVQQEKTEIELVVNRFNGAENTMEEHTFTIPVEKDSPFIIYTPQVVVEKVYSSSPAFAANMQPNDIIKKIEQADIRGKQQVEETIRHLYDAGKKNIRITIDRSGIEKTVIVRFNNDIEGVGMDFREEVLETQKEKILLAQGEMYLSLNKVSYGFWDSTTQGLSESFRWLGKSFEMITSLVSNIIAHFALPDTVGGPIAIADTTNQLVEYGDFSKILQFAAVLSLSLAVVNIMPFPGLDGGRLFFLLGELVMRTVSRGLYLLGLKKKKFPTQLPEKYEMPLHMLGYICLLGLIIAITYKDIMRIFFS